MEGSNPLDADDCGSSLPRPIVSRDHIMTTVGRPPLPVLPSAADMHRDDEEDTVAMSALSTTPVGDPPPLSNASIALAEFASLLSGPESGAGNQYLKEHITHLLNNVESSNTLVTVARALESAQVRNDVSELSPTGNFGESAHSDDRTQTTSSTFTGAESSSTRRQSRPLAWQRATNRRRSTRGSGLGPDLARRRSTFGFSQTETESRLDESRKTRDELFGSPHSTDLMMGDDGSIMDDQPQLFSSLIGGSISAASTSSSAAMMDPLGQESPHLPKAVRLEGRRAAVSAIPSGLMSMGGGTGANGLGGSLANYSGSTTSRTGSRPLEPVTPQETEKLVSLLKASHLFSSLEGPELEEVVRAMRKESYPAGTAVLEQGQDSKEKLFLIFEGTCEVIKQGKTLAAMQSGATFGELELMYKQIKCAATIRCVTNCVFFTLGEEAYHRAVVSDSVKKRRRFEQLTESAPFLRCLPQYERNKVAEALHTVQYKKGQHVIRFGEKGSHLYFIIEGEVKVVGRSQGRRVEVVRLHKGDVVGELEFLFNHLSVADVVVLSRRLRAARISREHFELIVGPIHDRLKEFIATSPSYEKYYVKSVADDSVRSELNRASSTQHLRPRRVESASGRAESLTLLDVDPEGEMVIAAPVPLIGGLDGAEDSNNDVTSEMREGEGIMRHEVSPGDVAQRAFRFPLAPVTRNRWVLIGLREDGLILTWNKTCEKLTDYSAAEVVGQNIYSLLLETADQKAMYHAIAHAKKYAGTVQDYETDLRTTKRKYTLARSDGLTKAVLSLSVLPPVMARGCDATPEMVLAVGEEVSQGPQKALDQTHWLSKQVRLLLADGSLTYEERLARIAETLANYEDVYRAMTLSTERLRVVNIHQMFGLVIMDFAVECVQKRIAVCQRFEGLPSECAYLDAELLPQCLRYAMHTTAQFNDNCQLTITVTVTEKSDLEFLVINFNVSGGAGFPEVYEEYINVPLDDADDEALLTTVHTLRTTMSATNSSDSSTAKQVAQLRRVRLAVEQQGGTMRIQQTPPDTANILFLIPFMAAQEVGDAAGDRSLSQSRTNADGASQASASLTNTESAVSLPTGASDLLFADGTARSSAAAVVSGDPASAIDDGPAYNFTTLVAEDTPAHRNMLCAYLWERRHAVLPAYSLADIERLSGVADILFIDLQQSIMSSLTTQDPIALLREKARQMAVIITATDFDMIGAETYQKAGFITLKKPCAPVQALQAIRKAEDKIAAAKQEAERIAKTRETLSKNSRGAWKRGALLGKGSFGEVYEAIDVLTGGKMAVKELRLGGQNNVKVENFVDEIATMCNLQHPNIIHYFYCEESMEGASKVFRVFMEFAAGGTVQGLLTKKGKLPFAEFQRLLHDVTEGLAYIHAQHYVHGDIKTANVLLGHDEKGKIGDFGTARRVKQGELLYDMQGSPLYMSPECMSAGEVNDEGEKIGYSFPTDIWSLGCVVLEMVTGKPPFSHIKKFNGPAGFTNFITSLSDTPDLSPLFSEPPSVTEFVSACLKPDPAERATAQDLLHMSIFSESADDDTKSAVKALKRAQLLHVLNKFVAFQDPEDAKKKQRQQNQFVTRHRSVNDFFASSSSSSDATRGSSHQVVASAPANAGAAVRPRQHDFFSSSSSNVSSSSGASTETEGNMGSAGAQQTLKAKASTRLAEEGTASITTAGSAPVEIDYTPTEFPQRRRSFRVLTLDSQRSSMLLADQDALCAADRPGEQQPQCLANAAHHAAHAAAATVDAGLLAANGGDARAGSVSAVDDRNSSAEPAIRVPSSDAADLSPTPKKRSRTRARDEVASALTDADETTPSVTRPVTAKAKAAASHASAQVAAARDLRSPHPPSTGASWERSSSQHNAHGSETRGATALYLTNASFVNFSFNRNISFMGANMNDVLNSVANEFMSNLAGASPGASDVISHRQPESTQAASSAASPSVSGEVPVRQAAVSPTGTCMKAAHGCTEEETTPSAARASSNTAESAPASTSGDEPNSATLAICGSDGPSAAASDRVAAPRPAVVKAWLQKKLKHERDAAPQPLLSNRSFFMVQKLDNTRLGMSMRVPKGRGGLDDPTNSVGSTLSTASKLKRKSPNSRTDTSVSPPQEEATRAAPPPSLIPNAVPGVPEGTGEERRRAAIVVAPPPHTTPWNLSSSSSDDEGRKAQTTSTAVLTDEALRLHRASFTESTDAVQQLLGSPSPERAGGAVGAASSARASGHGSPIGSAAMLVHVETELHSIAGQLKHLLEERVNRQRHTDPLSPPAKPAPHQQCPTDESSAKQSTGPHQRYVLPISALRPTGSAPLSAELQCSAATNGEDSDMSFYTAFSSRETSTSACNPLAASPEDRATPITTTVAASDLTSPSDRVKGDVEGLLDHVERLKNFVAEQRAAASMVLSTPPHDSVVPWNTSGYALGESQLLAALQKLDRTSDHR